MILCLGHSKHLKAGISSTRRPPSPKSPWRQRPTSRSLSGLPFFLQNRKNTNITPNPYTIASHHYPILIRFTTQVVRSCSSWSAGQDLTEYSIQRALVATIEEAEHYVYIENQFFVSYVKGGTRPDHLEQVEVKIGCALLLISGWLYSSGYSGILSIRKWTEVVRGFKYSTFQQIR